VQRVLDVCFERMDGWAVVATPPPSTATCSECCVATLGALRAAPNGCAAAAAFVAFADRDGSKLFEQALANARYVPALELRALASVPEA
jgi:hypothetical protein